MNVEEFREYCLLKKGVTEGFPFDETTLVFKVMGKMFALTSLDTTFRVSLKTAPGDGERLREAYPCITTAPHFNKVHWILVSPDASLDDVLLKNLIDRSYELVVAGLTKKSKNELISLV